MPGPTPSRSTHWHLKLASGVTLAVLALWGALTAGMWLAQERLLFKPEPIGSDANLQVPGLTQAWLDVPGARLHTIHYQPALVNGTRQTKGLVFFLHGNVGNVATWFPDPTFWRESGYDLFMVDYRGFGRSTGHIDSEAQLHDDVWRAWQHIAPQYKDKGLKTVIYGRSLGSGLAVKLAAHVAAQGSPDLLVLVSPYTSMTALLHLHYPWLPDAALRYPLASDQVIGQVRSPVLIFHGLDDPLIPAAQSQALKARARQAQWVGLPGVAHGDVHHDAQYLQRLREALQGL